MPITKLEQMLDALRSKPRKKLVAAAANDEHTIEAVREAVGAGVVEGILVGDEARILEICKKEGIDPGIFKIINEPVEAKAALRAVAMVKAGEGDVLMKGGLSTDKYMKAILNKEQGLLEPGAILSHVTVVENPRYHKLLVVGDVAVIPAPELKEKTAILNYLINTAKALQVETPKVAVIAASEQVLPKMQACVDAAILAKMGDRGQIKGAVIDGPLALDVAIDKESAAVKGLKSQVTGDADCLLFPNIESGNVFYKSMTKLAGCETGAMVAGAKSPCVLTSRGDSVKSKLYSIALAALTA
ncbi:MAG: bifunctional enoyl-CoA hydratase/phosphate acetyltransferase [Holophagales bacterium]|jgi:phosphate butyryltransferase|nr:bifunctional enoyl-CoA hydratase/phosphate acetyltransferase [Holophagales bacterium]